MANYNHEILVNYLRDVYSMELLVRKIEDDIHSTREDIQCEQALVEKVESTPIPAEGNISPKKDITPYMIAGFLMFYCGPLSRFIFRAIFRKQLQAENQEQH